MTPEQLQTWLNGNLWRFDQPNQWLGTEPNAFRKPWDTAQVRWLLQASWPYFHSAGNQSIPAVYQAINDNPGYLCDLGYLPETPRDLGILEKARIPLFGIESKHQMLDFDVVGTSISYMVLFMNFCKLLQVSSIPLRWQERDLQGLQNYPMVIVGGQAFCAPGAMEPVVDAVWLGEVEDEPGNGGISSVCARIAMFKQEGTWQADRLACYRKLALEFNYLYFPRFMEVQYQYVQRPAIREVGSPQNKQAAPLSKQVSGYKSLLPGMRVPFTSRIVHDLDSIAPLRAAPLLYSEPGMGLGDLEVGRGCTCWCSFPLLGSEEVITPDGVFQIQHLARTRMAEGMPEGETVVWAPGGWQPGVAESHGHQPVQRIVFRPADRGTVNGAWRRTPRASRRVEVVATPAHGWVLVDGTETHNLQEGDFVPAAAVADAEESPDFSEGFVHGFLFGDGNQRKFSTVERRPAESGSFKVRLFGKDAHVRAYFEQFQAARVRRDSWEYRPDLLVTSIKQPAWAHGDAVVYGWASFSVKSWPAETASPAYLAGFLAGWIRADGSLRAKGTSYRIAASYLPKNHGDVTPVQWLSRFAAAAGWVYVGSSQSACQDTNFGSRTAPLWEHTLVRPEGHGWCVESIEPLRGVPEVFCFTVPGAHKFTLASGVATANCRLSWVTKPYRQRSVGESVKHAKEWKLNMGPAELSPFAPDFPVHTRKRELLGALLEQVSDEIDTTALRVDDFIADKQYVILQAQGGADAITIGVEGSSQRMRDMVGKGAGDVDVEEAMVQGIRAGFRKFKLFMINNLPGEDRGDVLRAIALARRLADVRDQMGAKGVVIQLSFTPLLIEAQTPFQWFAPTPPNHDYIEVADALRDINVQFKIGDLDYREPVLTPDRGFVPIGQLQIGDRVVDPEGSESWVTGVFPMGRNKTYRVSWSDGTSVLATDRHPWDIVRWETGQRVSRNVNTAWLRKSLTSRCEPPYLVTSPGLAVQDLGPDDQLGLDPYLLGLLLGDGCLTKRVPQFASADAELIEAVRQAVPPGVGLTFDSMGPGGKVQSFNLAQLDGGGNQYPRRENPVTRELRRTGLWGHRAWDKFVPEDYKWAPAKIRLAVLQGLMDTDGTVRAGDRSAAFGSSSRQLRDDVAWLARSLGLVVRTGDYASWATGPGGARKAARTCFRAMVWPTAETPIFRLVRKAERMARSRPVPRKLVSVELEGEAETVCISVSAPSERYIAGTGLVPTHNTKANPAKVALFQLCQRASREVGEAIIDVFEQHSVASWGGVPKTVAADLEASLVNHGFRNGFDDCFDERFQHDLFGHEYISTGVSQELMFKTYQQMLEFVQGTNSETYDSLYDERYHGNEWVERCDTGCQGSACGACSPAAGDFRKRKQYVEAAEGDRSITRDPVRIIDLATEALWVRAELNRPQAYRTVGNPHWRAAVRRAAYRASDGHNFSIAKRSIRFASDAVQAKDWSAGADYVQFALTSSDLDMHVALFMSRVKAELGPWVGLQGWELMGPQEPSLAALGLYELEVDASLETLESNIMRWGKEDYVPLKLLSGSAYFGLASEDVNAKDYVHDLWAVRDGHRVALRFITEAKAGAYQAAAAFLGKPSWLPLAQYPVTRLDWLVPQPEGASPCPGCGQVLYGGLLDPPSAQGRCPRCQDSTAGRVVAGLKELTSR